MDGDFNIGRLSQIVHRAMYSHQSHLCWAQRTCVKGTEKSASRVDSSVPWTHHDPRNLGLICLETKRKTHFRFLSDLRVQSWIFLKKNLQGFI